MTQKLAAKCLVQRLAPKVRALRSRPGLVDRLLANAGSIERVEDLRSVVENTGKIVERDLKGERNQRGIPLTGTLEIVKKM